jgi:phenylacetate-CoA ligase
MLVFMRLRSKIKYVSSEQISETKTEKIKIEMGNYLEKGLTIIFERLDKIERSKSGKLKQFSSLLNIDSN